MCKDDTARKNNPCCVSFKKKSGIILDLARTCKDKVFIFHSPSFPSVNFKN